VLEAQAASSKAEIAAATPPKRLEIGEGRIVFATMKHLLGRSGIIAAKRFAVTNSRALFCSRQTERIMQRQRPPDRRALTHLKFICFNHSDE